MKVTSIKKAIEYYNKLLRRAENVKHAEARAGLIEALKQRRDILAQQIGRGINGKH